MLDKFFSSWNVMLMRSCSKFGSKLLWMIRQCLFTTVILILYHLLSVSQKNIEYRHWVFYKPEAGENVKQILLPAEIILTGLR